MATTSPGIPTPLLQITNGGGSCSGVVGIPGRESSRAVSLLKPVQGARNPFTGIIESSNAYSRGVIQGLQRALVSFSASRGRSLGLSVDGNLNEPTVLATISALNEIGLPRGIDSMPSGDEGILRNARIIAEHVSAAAGVSPVFIPGEDTVVSSKTFITAPASAETKKAPLFSKRNLTLGLAVAGGFFLLSR